MNFANIFSLISKEESYELFKCQNGIINNRNFSNTEKLIRLSILQTLPPIEDWESASKMLKEYIYTFDTFNLLVGAFISLTAYELTRYKDIDYFISLIDEITKFVDDEFLSIAYFIKSKYIIEKQGATSEAIKLLNLSIEYGPKFVMNYIELSKYSSPKLKIQYLENAILNVQNTYNSHDYIDLNALLNPINFYNERIIGIDMNRHVYDKIVSSLKSGEI